MDEPSEIGKGILIVGATVLLLGLLLLGLLSLLGRADGDPKKQDSDKPHGQGEGDQRPPLTF